MKYFHEKEAEDFLEEEGFNVVSRGFAPDLEGLKDVVSKVGFPLVMKVYGNKIVHKNRVDGVKKRIKTFSDALHNFSVLMRIKGARGVVIQKEVIGKEFFIGVKRTPEFGHVVVFGRGGIDLEKDKDVSYGITPFDKFEARKMMDEVDFMKYVQPKDRLVLEKNLLRMNELVGQYNRIKELDINPIMVEKGKGFVVDARILFD